MTTDINGVPWDVRIHSVKKEITPDGGWKLRRGVSPILVTKVVSELRAAMATTAIEIPPVPTEPPFVPSAMPSVPLSSSIPIPPSVKELGGAAATASPSDHVPFPKLVNAIIRATSEGCLTFPMVTEACTRLGVSGLTQINSRPELISALIVELGLTI